MGHGDAQGSPGRQDVLIDAHQVLDRGVPLHDLARGPILLIERFDARRDLINRAEKGGGIFRLVDIDASGPAHLQGIAHGQDRLLEGLSVVEQGAALPTLRAVPTTPALMAKCTHCQCRMSERMSGTTCVSWKAAAMRATRAVRPPSISPSRTSWSSAASSSPLV